MSLLIAALVFTGAPAVAQGWGNSFSPGEARDARRAGDIVPLRQIFRDLERRHGGYQLNAELFSKRGGGSEYRIDWMTRNGRKLYVVVDAQTGRVVQSRGG